MSLRPNSFLCKLAFFVTLRGSIDGLLGLIATWYNAIRMMVLLTDDEPRNGHPIQVSLGSFGTRAVRRIQSFSGCLVCMA